MPDEPLTWTSPFAPPRDAHYWIEMKGSRDVQVWRLSPSFDVSIFSRMAGPVPMPAEPVKKGGA